MAQPLSEALLDWYDLHKRALPFRGGRDPYGIWVSEIMLQQTRTETVSAYWQRFMARFPDVFALAAAPEQEVLKLWEGLGYYSRARNLHKAAQVVVEQYSGQFPRDIAALRALPGVGDYTAAAVGSIAFDLPAPAMDGNLTRVLARVHGIRQDVGIPSVKRQLQALGEADMPPVRCGDFNQALMDLGATVCTPGTPNCFACPLQPLCDAFAQGDAETLPMKAAANPPKEIALAVVIAVSQGRVLMTQRKEKLLNNLWVYPLLENAESKTAVRKGLRTLGVVPRILLPLGQARHIFTHRIWNMQLWYCAAQAPVTRSGVWVTQEEMQALPIPTAVRAARLQAEALLSPFRCAVLRGTNPTADCLPGFPGDLTDKSRRALRDALLPAAAEAYAESWRASHAAFCSEAFVQAHSPQRMEETLREQLEKGRDVLPLFFRGDPAGVLVVDPQENEVVSLYIHPACQRQGLGRWALDWAITQLLDSSRDMRVTTLNQNHPALSLYRQSGFTQPGETRLLNAERNLLETDWIRPASASADSVLPAATKRKELL